MTDLLLKAVFQKQLTPDTVEIQFCSNWLKDQITDLFTKISTMEEKLKAYELLLEESQTGRLMLFEQLQEAKEDALKFGRAMESERNEKHFLSVELEIVRDDRNKLRDGIKTVSDEFLSLVDADMNNGDIQLCTNRIISELERLNNV